MDNLEDMNIPADILAQMVSVRKCLVELLVEFDRICALHDIKYSIAYGTLLGAVRHKGFIPWDDDVDVMMSRAEYNKLLRFRDDFCGRFRLLLPGELNDNTWLDNIPRILHLNTRMHTPAGEEAYYGNDLNHEVLDIFIFDDISDCRLSNMLLYAQNIWFYGLLMGHRQELRRGDYSLPAWIVTSVLSHIGRRSTVRDILSKREKCLTRYNGRPTKSAKCRSFNIHMGLIHESVFDRSALENVSPMRFENVDLYGSDEYDNVLHACYGEYMTPPSREAIEREFNSKHYLSRDAGFEYYEGQEVKFDE